MLPELSSAEKSYEVQSDDTLYSIAEDYQVDVNTLIAANASVEDESDIQAGETIQIPDEDGVSFKVTAYTAGEESTDKNPDDPDYGITASGEKVKENHTIACPPSLPFGTKIHIPELDETYVCEDRGSAITNERLDIYKEDLDDALDFGVQELQVKVWTY
ncbi:MAG TPA: LysM peptidoglycan-binding domain-containing protein [Pseudogracilibacillus sp.]|nr:LysM peptidoglycan-binding domain-containing protein [Pseudogracilibacillus sp.]